MLKAFALAWRQVFRRDLRALLLKTLGWTLLAYIVVWAFAFRELAVLLGNEGTIGLIGGLALLWTLLWASWWVFSVVENAIILNYADAIIARVEARYYPRLAERVPRRMTGRLWRGVRLGIAGLICNLLALPLYLLTPGVNLLVFLALNGYFVGRGYFDTVAPRHLDDAEMRQLWAAYRVDYVLNGVVAITLASVPLLNLVAPVIGLATAVHLTARGRGERLGRNHAWDRPSMVQEHGLTTGDPR